MTSEPASPPKPIFTYGVIALCVVAFLFQTQDNARTMQLGALWPLGEYFRLWQPLTYAFLHGGLSHLGFNLFGLHLCGSALEPVIGSRRLAFLYFMSVLAAALAQLLVLSFSGGLYPTVGASGGVFGLLLVFALLFPERRLMVFPLPIPIKAWLFVTLYAGVELFLGVTGTLEGIAHFAHLGGLAGGGLTWVIWRAEFARRQAMSGSM